MQEVAPKEGDLSARNTKPSKLSALELRRMREIRKTKTVEDLTAIVRKADLPQQPNVAAAALRRCMELRSNPNHIIQGLSNALIRNSRMTVYSTTDCLVSLSILYTKDSDLFERYAPIQLLLCGNIQSNDVKHLSIQRLIQMVRITQALLPEVEETYGLFCTRLGQGDLLAAITAEEILKVLSLLDASRPTDQTLIAILAKRIRKSSIREHAKVTTLLRVMQRARGYYETINDDAFNQKIRTVVTSLATHIIERDDFHGVHMPQILRAIRSLYTKPPQQYIKAVESMQWTELNAHDIATILDVVVQWGIHISDDAMRNAGECLNSMGSNAISPRQATTVLRCAGLLYYPNAAVMAPFEVLATKVTGDQTFLAKSTVGELANLAWFVAFKSKDQSSSAMLGERLLDPNLVKACSPKQACRIISAFARIPTELSGQDTAWRLYQAYGVHLLSSNLNPAELSSAMYGFAKVDYVYDMGVFDHLVQSLVQQIDVCSTRQRVQALWACGKIFIWEQGSPEATCPPYLENARILAKYVVSRANELLPVEIAQTVWALARLSLPDDGLLAPLLSRSRQLANDLSPVESSNILWALGKLKSKDFKTVYLLSRRYASPITFEMKPKEAATILYAFSLMNIRDEDVFKHVTVKILEQTQAASPQIMASVLRSHTVVHIAPPSQFLDQWAITKLGLNEIALDSI